MKEKVMAELFGTRLVVWNPTEGVELYRSGFFGKPIGIPKPKPNQPFDAPLVLDLMEGLYLMEKDRIVVLDHATMKPLSKKRLLALVKKHYKSFEEAYLIYKDLRDKGLVVTPGIKFGADFAVYEHGPGIDHAPFIVTVRNEDDLLGPFDIVRAGRLATTVRKQFTIAMPKVKQKKVSYLTFKWFKA